MSSGQNSQPLFSRNLIGAIIIILLTFLAFLASASMFPASSAGLWYVAPGGDDSSSCQSPAEPCATINGAIGKASPGDTVNVAVGTYTPLMGSGEVVLIDKDVNLSGGWDVFFAEQSGLSTIDANLYCKGIKVDSGVTADIESFVVQEGYNGGVVNSGTITMTDVTISNNQYQGIANTGTMTITGSVITDNYWVGIANDGTLFLSDSMVIDNRTCAGCYGGISSYGTALIQNSTISHNAGWGLYSSSSHPVTIMNSTIDHNSDFGVKIYAGTVIAVNSTVSSNTRGGFYVENNGSLSIYNTTVSYNGNSDPTTNGGGIRVGWGTVRFANTILANNVAAAGPDCYKISGSLISDGFNLIGNTLGCSYTPGAGDLTNLDPRLAWLFDNGGATRTHGLFSTSPAIDAGDPSGCTDHLDNPLTADQRGYPRLDRCDIGAYERQPGSGPAQVFLPCLLDTCPELYSDDFSDPASGWPTGDDPDYLLEYLDDEYRILLRNIDLLLLVRSGFKGSDYIAEVDVRNVDGTEGVYGLLFGLDEDWTELYIFVISPYGDYWLLKYSTASDWTVLAQGTSGAIYTGTASNQIKVRRSGAEISIYANGQLLTSISDDSFTGLRYVGLTANSISQPNLDVRFDNFTIYPLTCQSGTASLGERCVINSSDAGIFIGPGMLIKRK